MCPSPGYSDIVSPEAEKLIEQVVNLPETDRVRVAEQVLASLDGEADADAASAWAEEIARRSREIEQGTVQPIPWSEVKASARKALVRD